MGVRPHVILQKLREIWWRLTSIAPLSPYGSRSHEPIHPFAAALEAFRFPNVLAHVFAIRLGYAAEHIAASPDELTIDPESSIQVAAAVLISANGVKGIATTITKDAVP